MYKKITIENLLNHSSVQITWFCAISVYSTQPGFPPELEQMAVAASLVEYQLK